MPQNRFGKKLRYFLDYYFLKTAAVLFGAAVVILFFVNYFRNPPDTVLYAAVYDLTLDMGEKKALAERLAERTAEMTGKETDPSQLIIDDTFRSDSAKDVERVQVLAANHAVDVIIAPDKEIMKGYASYGYLTDLPEILPSGAAEQAEEEGRLIKAPGMLWTDEISFEDHESGQGEEKPYILELSGCGGWKALAGDDEMTGFFGIVLDTPHEEAAALLAEMLLEGEE